MVAMQLEISVHGSRSSSRLPGTQLYDNVALSPITSIWSDRQTVAMHP